MNASYNIETPPNDRTQPRSSMFLSAVMRAGTEQAPVKVRNMSSSGALIETRLAPAEGTNVLLLRGPLVAEGTVVWASSSRCGLKFSSEVSLSEWLATPTAIHQQRVDEMVALVKAGKLSVSTGLGPSHGAAGAASLHEEVIGDLGAVVLLLQDLEDDITSSSETVVRHQTKLQNLDLAMQVLRALAGEMAPEGKGGTPNLAKLEDLRVACAKALET